MQMIRARCGGARRERRACPRRGPFSMRA